MDEDELLRDVLENSNVSISVGKTPLTSKREATGQLTNPFLKQVEKFGAEGLQAYAKGNRFDYRDRLNANAEATIDVAFDPEEGKLIFIKRSGKRLNIDGFLIQPDFGVGPTGPRGHPGNDGYDADDGGDGRKGKDGCEGPKGPVGPTGPAGSPGNDGPKGPDGYMGPAGPRGNQGPAGYIGPNGFDGARGRKGPDCSAAHAGAGGAAGPSFGDTIFGEQGFNMPTAALVVLPDDGAGPAPVPPGGWNNNSPNTGSGSGSGAGAGGGSGSGSGTGGTDPDNGVWSDTAIQTANPKPFSLSTSNPPFELVHSCRPSADKWWPVYAYDHGYNGAKGVGVFADDNDIRRHFQRNDVEYSMVLSTKLRQGARYTFEVACPHKVTATVYINCTPFITLSSEGLTWKIKTSTLLAEEGIITVKYVTKDFERPAWVSMKIMSTIPEDLYLSGTNRKAVNLPGEYPGHYSEDVNWKSNSRND